MMLYIETCIQSLIRQTMGNIEVILVDDGSTDRSGELCDQYAEADERIRVIHKQNGGLSSARNAGISAAKGEYLLFVDSDDYVSASLVEKTVSCAEQNQADVVVFDYQEIELCSGGKQTRTSACRIKRRGDRSEECDRISCNFRSCSAWISGIP